MDERYQTRKKLFGTFSVFVGIFLVMIVAFYFSGRPPARFVSGTIVTVPKDSSTAEVGSLLEQFQVIRSKALFQFYVKVMLGNKPVIAGDFSFEKKQSVFQVARMITGGKFGAAQTKITIPEGSSSQDVGRIIQKAIPSWNADEFVAKAKGSEGYLFPETYFVFKTITPDGMIERLKKEYENRVAPLRLAMVSAKKSESQIVTMASILEKEARNAEEARIISGILWKRIEKGIPLQVDAPFLYTLGKTSEQLTTSDLQKDGPYNTYTRKGLPKGPIGNPGLATIDAAIHPVNSPYYYYLHDNKGVVHYAKTHDEHVQNKKKYLQ